MIRDENGLLAGYVYVDFDTSKIDVGSYVDAGQEGGGRDVKLPTGYSLTWSGQYENMLRVRERLKLVLPLTLVLIFGAALHEHQVGLQGGHRHAGRALLGHRRGLAALGSSATTSPSPSGWA